MFSSKSMEWATPQSFFDKLNKEFHFTLDPCADEFNHKCDKYFTEKDNGLEQCWGGYTVFCNPPYGRSVKDWVKKCSEEAKKPGTMIVLLIPARTDTSYFHDYIYQKPNVEIRFVRGRLKFGDGKNSAPFPSMIVIFRSETMTKMTLSEAIEHCRNVVKRLGCCKCAEEHLQLATWLEELKRYKKEDVA